MRKRVSQTKIIPGGPIEELDLERQETTLQRTKNIESLGTSTPHHLGLEKLVVSVTQI
tara:strand:- start:1009 stop:1182 length:174 start_codon:yes stop_codon:yes gene_type:complete